MKKIALIAGKDGWYLTELLLSKSYEADGTIRKVTGETKTPSLERKYAIDLDKGIERLYKWYVEH